MEFQTYFREEGKKGLLHDGGGNRKDEQLSNAKPFETLKTINHGSIQNLVSLPFEHYRGKYQQWKQKNRTCWTKNKITASLNEKLVIKETLPKLTASTIIAKEFGSNYEGEC